MRYKQRFDAPEIGLAAELSKPHLAPVIANMLVMGSMASHTHTNSCHTVARILVCARFLIYASTHKLLPVTHERSRLPIALDASSRDLCLNSKKCD